MAKLHIRKNDTVMVLAGEDKGKTGKVLKVLVLEEHEAERQEPAGWYREAGGSDTYLKFKSHRSEERQGYPCCYQARGQKRDSRR